MGEKVLEMMKWPFQSGAQSAWIPILGEATGSTYPVESALMEIRNRLEVELPEIYPNIRSCDTYTELPSLQNL